MENTLASSNSLLSVNHEGTLIATSNRDSGSVSFFDGNNLTRQSETLVGLHPEATAFVGQTRLLACCVYGDDEVVILDANSGKIIHRIPVFDEPYGIVSTQDGKFLYLTLEYPGQVIRIETESWSVDAEWNVGRMLRGIALAPNERSLFVTEYLSAKLIQVSVESGTVLNTFAGASTDNLARQVVIHPTGSKAYIPHVRSKVTAAHGNGSIFPYVGVTTLTGDEAGRRLRIPMDTFRGTRVVANPWEVALSPDGLHLFVIFGATNDLYACRIEPDGNQELSYEATLRLGNNPRAVRVHPNGQSLLVYNALDFELVSYRLPDLTIEHKTTVTDFPLSEEHRLGKMLFYTALAPMSGRSWISCSSCHIDGDADGRTWQQPEGLRQTQPLNGLAWTHPLHWSADRDEVQDFEHTIRGELMQGRGLLKGPLPTAMAEPISGRSEMLDALAVYTNSHKVSLSPHARHGLTDAARRGQTLFHSAETKCATCHQGAFYTDSKPAEAAKLVRHDVGTGHDDPSELMEPAYDTPTLLGIYRSAPYLHHGKALTLRDVLTTYNKDDQHGTTSHLTEQQLNDLVEFLKALPFEDPESQAEAQGLTRVVK